MCRSDLIESMQSFPAFFICTITEEYHIDMPKEAKKMFLNNIINTVLHTKKYVLMKLIYNILFPFMLCSWCVFKHYYLEIILEK